MAVTIQPRDLDIFKYVFAFRVVSYEQIRRKFFAGVHPTAAYSRLRKLCKANYLRSFPLAAGATSTMHVSLREKAWPSIENLWGFEVDSPRFKSDSLDHDVRLAEIHSRLERLRLYRNYLSENLLQSSTFLATNQNYRDLVNIRADGALELKEPSGEVYLFSIELELSKKAPDRYRKKLEAYNRAGGIDGVIYICGDLEIMGLIERIDTELGKDRASVVYLGTEASVLECSDKIFFKRTSGKGIGLY